MTAVWSGICTTSLSLPPLFSPSLLEISELCILGCSPAILLRWILDHTMKAFIGLLTRSRSAADLLIRSSSGDDGDGNSDGNGGNDGGSGSVVDGGNAENSSMFPIHKKMLFFTRISVCYCL